MQCLHVIYSYKTKHKKRVSVYHYWMIIKLCKSVSNPCNVWWCLPYYDKGNYNWMVQDKQTGVKELWGDTQFKEQSDSNRGRQTGRGGIGGGERCSPHSPAQSGSSRYPSPIPSLCSPSFMQLLAQWGWMNIQMWRTGWRWGWLGKGGQDRERGREGEGGLLGH